MIERTGCIEGDNAHTALSVVDSDDPQDVNTSLGSSSVGTELSTFKTSRLQRAIAPSTSSETTENEGLFDRTAVHSDSGAHSDYSHPQDSL